MANALVQLTKTNAAGVTISLGISTDTGQVRLTSKDLDLGDANIEKVLTHARFLFDDDAENSSTMKVTFRGRNKLNEEWATVVDAASLDEDSVVHFEDFPGYIYWLIELIEQPSRSRWHLNQIELFGEPGAQRLE